MSLPHAVFWLALVAVGLDRWLGEPRRWHPLVGFGAWADALERRLNPGASDGFRKGRGVLAWMLAVLPWVALVTCFSGLVGNPPAGWGRWAGYAVDALCLYFALGAQSLAEHAEAIATPLAAGDLPEARRRVGWIVSRQTDALDETGVAKAAVESVLENGNDAVFGALFWFFLLGGPGAVLFRLANTLDAMWGYKNARFLHFGWAAARLDDVLNWLPARLTALTYAVQGKTKQALTCWKTQAAAWESPNAGPVMSAGAGSLGVLLGGAAIYHGQEETRPVLGAGQPPQAADIRRAVRLMQRGMIIWLIFLLFLLS